MILFNLNPDSINHTYIQVSNLYLKHKHVFLTLRGQTNTPPRHTSLGVRRVALFIVLSVMNGVHLRGRGRYTG